MQQLAPWDTLPYFLTPVERSVGANGLTGVQICEGNSMRVALIFACGSNGAAGAVSTQPDFSNSQGIYLSPTSPIILTHAGLGPLVTVPWFVGCPAGAQDFTVIEIIMKEWPIIKEGYAHAKLP